MNKPLLLCSLVMLTLACDDPLGEPPPANVDSVAVYVTNMVDDAAFIDFCVRGDGPWLGPVMNQLIDIPEGLAMGETEGPFPIASGQYIARLSDAETAFCFPGIGDRDFDVDFVTGDYDVVITGNVQPMAGQDPLEVTVSSR